jgi:hypothetical protein
VTYRRVLDGIIGFIDTLYTALGTTGNYSAIAISTIYSSLLENHYGSQPSFSTSRFLATDYNSLTVNIKSQ